MAHDIKALLSLYDEAYQRKFPGVKAPISGSKDAALAKQLLGRYTLAQLATFLDAYFQHPDPFVQQGGYTFGVFVSCLGKVIAFAETRKQLQATRETARQLLTADAEYLEKIRRVMWARREQQVQDHADEYYRTHPHARQVK